MKLRDLTKRISQWIIIILIILFFLNLGVKLPFIPDKFGSMRPFAESHFLRDFLIIAAISFLITFLSGRIKQGCLVKLTNSLKRIKESHFLAVIFVLYFLINCLAAYFIFETAPVFMDSVSYINQAKIFSTGRLYAPTPLSVDHFCIPTDVAQDGKWYSRYPPGFSLILTLGIMFKLPLWIVNPILASLSLIVIYILGRELYNKRIGIYASILAFFSPFLLFCNGTFESETPALFFILLFILFFSSMLKKDKKRYPVLSGLSLGAAFITRPYSALFVSLPFIIYLGYLFFKRKKDIFQKAYLFSCGFVIFLLFFLWYNWQLTGSPFTLTYNVSDRYPILKYDYPGFHIAPYIGRYASGALYVFGPIEAIVNMNRNFILLNRDLFGWPVSLVFIFIPFLFFRKNKWDILLIFLFFSILLGHFFYWSPNIKYWHAASPALLLLTARGIAKAPLLLRKIGIPKEAGRRFIFVFVGICFLYSILLWQPHFWKSRKDIICYGKARMLSAVRNSGIHNTIIFIKLNPVYYIYHTFICEALTDKENSRQSVSLPVVHPVYLAGLSQNSPGLQDDILYALDLGEKNTRLIKYYPGRRYFIYEYNLEKADSLYEVYKESPG